MFRTSSDEGYFNMSVVNSVRSTNLAVSMQQRTNYHKHFWTRRNYSAVLMSTQYLALYLSLTEHFAVT